MNVAPSREDFHYCRDVLPRVSRTFAIVIRLLHGPLGEAVRTAYLLCRTADALEDSLPGSGQEIGRRFDLLLDAVKLDPDAASELARESEAVAGGRADLELVSRLPSLQRVFAALPAPHREAIAEAVRTLASGMKRYATRSAERAPGAPYLDTEEELHDYCFVVAGCVGVMLTRLFDCIHPGASDAARKRRIEIAPMVGEALQLTNIVLDWPADIRCGRCYVPATWLESNGLAPSDLVGRDRPEVHAIAARLEGLARSALAFVPDYLDLIHGGHLRYRLFCLWPALWALASLRHARSDPEFPWGVRRPRLPRAELWRTAVGSLAAHRGAGLRRFYAATA